jgi:hypothetical protein
VGTWGQNGSYGDWLGGCGLDSTGSGQGPVAGCCECSDEPSGSCTTELVIPGTQGTYEREKKDKRKRFIDRKRKPFSKNS